MTVLVWDSDEWDEGFIYAPGDSVGGGATAISELAGAAAGSGLSGAASDAGLSGSALDWQLEIGDPFQSDAFQDDTF